MASTPLKLNHISKMDKGGTRLGRTKSDDTAFVRQVLETHAPGPSHIVDVKPILSVIDRIFHSSRLATDAGVLLGTHLDSPEDRTSSLSYDVMLQGLSYLILEIYSEIICQRLSCDDVHTSTMELLRSLSSYSWEAKVVLSLAAFSMYYGEFWLVAQLCTTNSLAKTVAILKQPTDMIEHAESVKPQLQAIDNLIKAITNVTKRIVEFSDMVKLQSQYISEDTPSLSISMAQIPLAAYWTIRGILACALHFAILTGSRYEYNIASITKVTDQQSTLAHKLNNILEHLASELDNYRRYIEQERYDEDYKNLVQLFRSLHRDNMKNLGALISHKDDIQPLVIGTSKVRFNLEVLRRRHVLLLITDLSLSYEEIVILDHIYKDQQNRAEVVYEFVWLPIVDVTVWDDLKRDKFEDLKSKMSWYAVHDPLIIEPPVIKFIRDYWHFDKKMIIVSLDPQGRVSSENAFHMLWIWGNVAFPFSDEKETALWNAESWRLELVADGIDQEILKWIDADKYICLFGSDDIEWIRKFTDSAKAVARLAEIPLELVYAGRSTATKEKLWEVSRTIENENLSRTWSDYTSTWFFWSRLDSMRCSKAKHHKTVDNDAILREVMTLLSYDGSDQGWVMVWRGSAETVKGNGQLALTTLDDFGAWRIAASELGFVPELRNQLKQRHQPHHCTRLISPNTPDKVVCTECGREMSAAQYKKNWFLHGIFCLAKTLCKTSNTRNKFIAKVLCKRPNAKT